MKSYKWEKFARIASYQKAGLMIWPVSFWLLLGALAV